MKVRCVEMRIKNVKEVVSVEKEVKKIIKNVESSKSSKIKEMFDIGLEVKEISSILEIRYQFSYNVISNYINMNNIEVIEDKKVSKKEDIINLYLNGKSNKEISIEMKVNYNYVFKVLKEYKLEINKVETK